MNNNLIIEICFLLVIPFVGFVVILFYMQEEDDRKKGIKAQRGYGQIDAIKVLVRFYKERKAKKRNL